MRLSRIAVLLLTVALIAWLLTLVPAWVWHPLVGRGYQLWSGIISDVSEVSLLVGLITGAVAARRFLQQHFECHVENCHKLGFHRVQGTHYRTCWKDHPVLSKHPRHGVPIDHIRREHRAVACGAIPERHHG